MMYDFDDLIERLMRKAGISRVAAQVLVCRWAWLSEAMVKGVASVICDRCIAERLEVDLEAVCDASLELAKAGLLESDPEPPDWAAKLASVLRKFIPRGRGAH